VLRSFPLEAAMEMPKPGDAHKKLSALVGEWAGDETLHPSPWDPTGGAAAARVTNRWIVDGFAVLQEYEQSRNGQVTFRGQGVFWYDPRRDEYVMHWWDSMGGTAGEYRGRFDGNRLTLGAPMPQGGHSRTSWLLTGPDAHDFVMEVSPDGQVWQPAMQGRYQRRGAAPARSATARKATKQTGKKAAASRRAAAPAARAKASKTPAKAAKKRGARLGPAGRKTGRNSARRGR
jgi:hypothetical protein